VFAGFIALHPDFLTQEIVMGGSGMANRLVVHTGAYFVYTLYFNLIFASAFATLFAQILRHKGQVKKQLISIFIGTFMAAMLSLVTNLMLPYLGNSIWIWLGPVWTLFYIFTVSFSIVKHQLFDIKLAAVRGVAYAGVLATLSLIYYAAAYIASFLIIGNHMTTAISISPFNMLLALVLAFLFQPVKHFFDKVTNDVFYRNAYSSETFFAELGTVLTTTTDLRGLLKSTSEEIAQTFKAEQVFFRLSYRNTTEHQVSAGTHRHANMPDYDMHMLDEYIRTTDNRVFMTDLLDEPHDTVRRMLHSHKVALVVPLTRAEERVGYLLLGEHLSGNYTNRDLKTLTAMRNELVIAIQNALSLHEVQELNATLQQRIDVATKELRSSNAQLKHLDEVKDEFMSMASHQLRTPLTSVKGYISMVLEGDAGKITPQQHKLLIEAFKSSERMVGLIADFLNVSRLQTGRFVIEKAPFDLREIVQQEVNDLQLIATSHDIKLRAKLAAGPFPVNADEQKLRQVIMNFIDNAVYYSHPNSTIIINLEKVAGAAALTVVDTGIGVPENEQSHLFNKFFRAKNARKQRPDGTGVGLYLARRVVTAHGGSMIFSSKEGKGSTFGFRLPLEKSEPSEAR
jgi:signal transduction histidine kinase